MSETENRGGLLKAALIFIALSMAFFLFGLHPLWNNEAMYAEVPREMLESKDFLYPTLNYAPFIFKPPLFFWTNMLSIWLFGLNAGPRVPEAFFAAGTIIFTYRIAARSSKTAGFMAGAALATSYGFLFHTATLLPDVPLGFFTACAVYYFLRISDGKDSVLWLYASLAMAVMTKGFLGVVFPGIAFAVFIAVEGRRDMVKKLLSVHGIAVFAAITVPWHILMELRNPGFLYDFIINEQVLRFFNERVPPDWDSISSPLFFIITLGWMMPWTAFLFQGARMAIKKRDAAMRMALYWGAGGMAFLLLSSQKMEYYQIPLFPPMAILAAGYLATLASDKESGKRAPGATVGSLALFLFGAAAACAAPFLLNKFSAELPAHSGGVFLYSAEICLLAVAAGGLAAYALARRKDYKKAFVAVLLSGAVLAAGSRPAMNALTPELSDAGSAKAAAKVLRTGDILVAQAEEEYEYSSIFCYYTGRRVLILKEGIYPIVPSIFSDKADFILGDGGFRRVWNSGSRVFFIYKDAPNNLIGLISSSPNVIYHGVETLICNKSETLSRK